LEKKGGKEGGGKAGQQKEEQRAELKAVKESGCRNICDEKEG